MACLVCIQLKGVSAYLASQDKDCIDVRKNPMETDVNMRADQREDRQKTAVPRLKLKGGGRGEEAKNAQQLEIDFTTRYQS